MAASPRSEIARSGHCWSHDHGRSQGLNIKLVDKSLLDLFIDDVFQSVGRSHGKYSGNPRKQHAFEAIEEIPEDDDETHLNDDYSANDDPYVDEDGNFLATEDVVSEFDDDLAIDDEEYHEALLGYREARDFMKEARVARGFYPVVVPIRSDKPTSRGKSESSGGKHALSCKTGRGKGGRGSKCSGRSSGSRGRIKKEKRQGSFWTTVHRVRKSVSCVVRLIIGHVTVQRWMVVLAKKRNLGAYAHGAWTCSTPASSVVKSV